MASRRKMLQVVGIMSGTSLDGIDYVLCSIEPTKTGRSQSNWSNNLAPKSIRCNYLDHASSKITKDVYKQLKRVIGDSGRMTIQEIAQLHHSLGRLYAQQLLRHCQVRDWRVDLVGLHGQTVYHNPPQATLQMGEASYLSARLEIPVVSDFRVSDLAVGGQGAPLITPFHTYLACQLGDLKSVEAGPITVHNLGGISNLTYFESTGLDPQPVLSFDTGPANMLIDLLVKSHSKGKLAFDKNGQWGRRGLPIAEILKTWLKHPYFRLQPPKSCGHQEFGEKFLSSSKRRLVHYNIYDQVSTATEFCALSIAQAYRKILPQLPQAAYFCGGGALNHYLLQRIQYHLPEVRVATTADLGWPVKVIEGAGFAYLAACRYWGISAHLPHTTGAQKRVHLGKCIDLTLN